MITKKDHQTIAAWVFGSLTFAFLVGVFIFSPDQLPPFKHRILSIVSSTFAGAFTYFLQGSLRLSGTPKLPYVGGIAIRATGCVAVWLLTMLWWTSDFAPVRVEKKVAVVPLIESEDVHLGDNVYPERWGYSHNPLNIAIFPQGARGLVYFDKEKGEFLSGQDGQTHIGQAFVTTYSARIRGIDFSSYKFVSAYESPEPEPEQLKKSREGISKTDIVMLGPTILYANADGKGNFYDRYAAVGVLRALDFTIPLAKAGIEFSKENVASVELLIECYHGGIRPGQSQNFELFLNGVSYEIRTMSSNMREKEVVRMPIILADIRFTQENVAGLFVLPWQETGPKIPTTGKGPVHFRDVGIVNAYFKVTKK